MIDFMNKYYLGIIKILRLIKTEVTEHAALYTQICNAYKIKTFLWTSKSTSKI